MCIKDAPEMERLFVCKEIKFCLPESPRADLAVRGDWAVVSPWR